MAGDLHLPKDFSKNRSYVGIVCVHPAGGIKEQTAGVYASKLADEGMVALTCDASYQGESGGDAKRKTRSNKCSYRFRMIQPRRPGDE